MSVPRRPSVPDQGLAAPASRETAPRVAAGRRPDRLGEGQRPSGPHERGDFAAACRALGSPRHVLLMGRAGTGKTTLVRRWLNGDPTLPLPPGGGIHSGHTAVVAPMALAARHLGGTTLHSFLGIAGDTQPGDVEAPWRPRRDRREALRVLHTLVIDEISMVRSDLLDSVATVLARWGPHPGTPWGGVRLVLVGDPCQLPPVARREELRMLREQRGGPWFFQALSWRTLDPMVCILEQPLRHSDARDDRILQAVRLGDPDRLPWALEQLNRQVVPVEELRSDPRRILISATKAGVRATLGQGAAVGAAATVGTAEAAHLVTSHARTGATDRSPSLLAAEVQRSALATTLTYGLGARVMFVVNDPDGRWVNGTFGTVTAVAPRDGIAPSWAGPGSASAPGAGENPATDPDAHHVTVRLDEGNIVRVTATTVDLTTLYRSGDRLRPRIVGSVRQLPFILAGALTIHRAQGRTLPQVAIDLSDNLFSPGQLYVALSRTRRLSDLVLSRPLTPEDVRIDSEVRAFLSGSAVTTGSLHPQQPRGAATPRARLIAHVTLRPCRETATSADGAAEPDAALAPAEELATGELALEVHREGRRIATVRTRVFLGGTPHGRAIPTLREAWPIVARQCEGAVVMGDDHLEENVKAADIPAEEIPRIVAPAPPEDLLAAPCFRPGVGTRREGWVAPVAPPRLRVVPGVPAQWMMADHLACALREDDALPESVDLTALARRCGLRGAGARAIPQLLSRAQELRRGGGREKPQRGGGPGGS